ncbi:hypothetical protein ACFV2U_39910 [Streptomyces sp. NPDC059697]|uniref:hypothetical protein n=1 Tax=Streptomyces sp. NPDC059697 TaxID=3346912 RepID=UPI00367FB697
MVPTGKARRATTVRLARRRPGPGRVRVRRPAGLRRWWRRIDWGRTGTITAVAAALAGLLLTGVSTLYDALVSQGELEQARQAADDPGVLPVKQAPSCGDG